jgi:hypothetical protein
MSDKSDEESVLGSLPSTRPTRCGRERRQTAGGTATKATPRKAAPKQASRPKPRPVRAGAPSLAESTERARTSEPPPQTTTTPPSGTELVTTAIQAAGELAQIGLAVGGQMLRRAVGKLPKP